MNNKKSKKIKLVGAALGCAYLGLKALAYLTQEKTSIDDDNPYLSAIADNDRPKRKETIYERFVKPELDSVLSFCGMITLLPVYAVTAAAVYLDDPGPVFFSQKRIGKGKHYFMLHKFRTMRMDAPHDTPTHLLSNPEQHITRVGRIIRQYSIDELPQLWDAYRHKISLVGPRPALWNQADLIAERDKYGANDVKPGITGLAQISGRDELEIAEKAQLDGLYAKNVTLATDVRCLFDTVGAVLGSKGVVEGGCGKRCASE